MPSTYYVKTGIRTGPVIGRRIREACELLEQIGPCGATELCSHLTEVEPSNMGKYCSRAVGLGLMTVERGLRGKVQYSIYTVASNWREIADMRRTTAVKPAQPQSSPWLGVSSIFQIGELPGGRDHTTVQPSVHRINRYIANRSHVA